MQRRGKTQSLTITFNVLYQILTFKLRQMYPICHFMEDLGRWNRELNDSSSHIRSQCCFIPVIKSVLQAVTVTPTLLLQQCRLNVLECEIKSVWAPTDFLSWGLAWAADKAFSPGHCSPTLQHSGLPHLPTLQHHVETHVDCTTLQYHTWEKDLCKLQHCP